MSSRPTLRVARPTDRLPEIAAMYARGLGLDVLGRFEDHDGFDGVMLGRPEDAFHLEFTTRRGHAAEGAPSGEHLLVLYEPDAAAWSAACERMLAAGFREVAAHNPYWDVRGRTFEDLDGYRVVLQNTAWPPAPAPGAEEGDG
jgi:catechol 2,3-dioxygenase-like lactoylglutathione lyase family enzyme